VTSGAAHIALKKPTGKSEMESKKTFFSGNGNPFFQPKLTIGAPNDIYEKKAGEVPEKVARKPGSNSQSQPFFTPQPIPSSSMASRKCQDLQRKIGDDGTNVPSVVDEVLNTPGQAMDNSTASFMESRFDYDFSNVKIHTDSVAAKSAQSINALAYTSNNSIVFNKGQYSPETESGKKLLAHELTHVVQQKGLRRKTIQRRVIPGNVTTNQTMLTRLGMTRQQVIDAITNADADAITLAQNAENALTTELANAQSGNTVDADTETILIEELGLSFNNPAHHALIRQQIRRFRTVRETLESGYLRYLALGIGNVSLVGCEPGSCGDNFAFSCDGNRLVVLCQTFWDTPDEQSATILHEPFHIWFSMARHNENALRRADASCFEAFALRVSGRDAPASCVGHTAG
jgi:hypothetical protein